MADPIFQGMQGIAQGLQQYQQNVTQDRVAQGQIDALVQQGGIQGVGALSPDGQALFQKVSQGKATLRDKLQLLGEANTAIAQKKQQMDWMQQAQQIQQGQLQNAMLGQRFNFLQSIYGQTPTPTSISQPAPTAAPANLPPPGQQGATQAPPPQGMPANGPQQPNPGMLSQLSQPMGQSAAQPPPAVLSSFLGGSTVGAGTIAQPTPISVAIPPPKPLTISDPQVQAMYPQALRMSMGDADGATKLLQQQVDSINKTKQAQYDMVANATKPTGNFYYKGPLMKDGLKQGDILVPEMIKGQGTIAESKSEGGTEVTVPLGTPAPGPVVQRGTGQPDQTASLTGNNPNDPAWQKDMQDAWRNVDQSAVSLGDANLLTKAATAWTAGNQGQFNAIAGDPTFAKFKSIFTGNNPAAALQTALATNTASILNQIRGPNGSVGGRILQTEYEQTAKMLGSPQMDNATIMAAAHNLQVLNDRRHSIDVAYATYRQNLPAGEAQKLAEEQFGQPPVLQAGNAPDANAPKVGRFKVLQVQ